MWKLTKALVAAGLLLAACYSAPTKRTPEQQRAASTAPDNRRYLTTPSALRELTKNYADFYVTLIRDACDELQRENEDANQRREAARIKLRSAMAAYDIATNRDAFTQLLDLIVVVTLQSAVWTDDGLADEVYGIRGQILIDALREARERVWDLGRLVFEPEQLTILDSLIWDWRRKHGDIHPVTLVRFTEFADSRAKDEIEGVETGGGLLAPVSEATAEVSQMRMLAERLFFLSKRAPQLITWQAETMAYEIMGQPEVARMLDTTHSIANSLDRATKVMEELPDRITEERKAILESVDKTGSTANETVKNLGTVIKDTKGLVKDLDPLVKESTKTVDALTRAIEAADRLMARYQQMRKETPPGPKPTGPPEPFRIKDYTEAIVQLANAIEQTEDVLTKTESLIASGEWGERIKEIRENTVQGVNIVRSEGETIIRTGFWLALGIFFAFFLMLGTYKFFHYRISRHLGAGILLCLFALEAQAQDLPQYRRVDSVSGKLRTQGSASGTIFFSNVRERFGKLYPRFSLVPRLDGSAAAPGDLTAGKCDIAVMSRPMFDPEIEAFKKKHGYEPTRVVIGVGPVVIWVNKYNPIGKKGLTFQQLDAIFSRTHKRGGERLRTWGELGLAGRWEKEPIRVFIPGPASGDRAWIRHVVLDKGEFAASARVEPGSAAITNGVGSHLGGIGFAGILFGTKRTVAVPIAEKAGGPFVAPTRENTYSGKYPLARRFFAYVNKAPGQELPLIVREFLAYCVADEGQDVAKAAGGFKLTPADSRAGLEALGKPAE